MKNTHIISLVLLAALGVIVYLNFGSGGITLPAMNNEPPANEFDLSGADSVVRQAIDNAPEDALLYIVNDVTPDEMAPINSYQTMKLAPSSNFTLLIPAYPGSKVVLYNLSLNETTGEYERGAERWSSESSDKGLILRMEMMREYDNAAFTPDDVGVYELYIEQGEYFGSYQFIPRLSSDEALPKFEYIEQQGKLMDMTGLD